MVINHLLDGMILQIPFHSHEGIRAVEATHDSLSKPFSSNKLCSGNGLGRTNQGQWHERNNHVVTVVKCSWGTLMDSFQRFGEYSGKLGESPPPPLRILSSPSGELVVWGPVVWDS